MKSPKQIAIEHLGKSAEHNLTVAKAHRKIADAHEEKASGTEAEDEREFHKTMAAAHQEIASSHADHVEHCVACMKALESGADVEATPTHESNRGSGGHLDGPKSFGTYDDLLKALRNDLVIPDGARLILPTDAPKARLVKRFGSPDPAAEAAAGIDESLKKVAGV